MLSIPSCKWSGALGSEYVNGTPGIYTVFIGCIPGALGKGGDTFGYPVGDLSRDLYLTTVIVYKDHIAIVNTAGGSIFRVDPEFLRIQFA